MRLAENVALDDPIRLSEEIGGGRCFLASDLAPYISGAVIPVDGGYAITRSDGKSA